MDIRKEIRRKEVKLQIQTMQLSVDRFDIEILKAEAEIQRLNIERAKSVDAIATKALELEALLQE